MGGTPPPYNVLVSTTDEIPGFEIIQYLGMTFGITVRSRGAGGQWIGGCQICMGGEISAYTESSLEARNDAIQRLIINAAALNANAVIEVRFDSERSGQSGSVSDIVAYGTAVRVQPKRY